MRILAYSFSIMILCLVQISSSLPINELQNIENLKKSAVLDSDFKENVKRTSRQVAINVGPVGVGVGPFGGVGVRVGRLFNLGVAPRYPIAYGPAVPVVYTAPVPFAYPGGYSYRSNYNYNYSY